jgi:glycosyltransferase involved in cell wall biosynthesis
MPAQPDARSSVMFICPTLRVGGAERALETALQFPDQLAFRPVVCCTYEPGVLGRKFMESGLGVHHSLAANRWDLRLLPRLVSLLRRERVRVLYDVMSDGNTLLYGLLAARLAGVHGTVGAVHHARPSEGRSALVRRMMLRLCSRVVALTEQHRLFIAQQYGVPLHRMRVVHNGVALDRFSGDPGSRRSRQELGLPLEGPLVAMVATLRRLKAHEVFLEAAGVVSREVPEAHFLLVGDGPERARLEIETLQRGLADRVHFLGFRSDVPQILAHVDVSVLSSNHEAFSISTLESMAAGKPVIATKVGLMDELISEGKTGFLVEAGDANGLAERLVRLLTHPDLAAEFGRSGRKRVEDHFSDLRMIAAIEAVVAEAGEDFRGRSTSERDRHTPRCAEIRQ